MICPKCNAENDANVLFCKKCGARLQPERAGKPVDRGRKNRWIWLAAIVFVVGIIFVIIRVGKHDSQNVFSESDLTFTVSGVDFGMVYVQKGTFTMGGDDGDSDEKPVHRVTLSNDYYIGQTEVTQALWEAVMGSNPCKFKGDPCRPVEQVNRTECETFCSRLDDLLGDSLRGMHFALPTEAQWEYAARGGNRSRGYTFAGSNSAGVVAWHGDNSNGQTHSVGSLSPNELGLYDMSGNVWEWCSDWYDNYAAGSQTDPVGPPKGFYGVFRGGSWGSHAEDCRVSHRFNFSPDRRYYFLGFRLALVP